MTGLLWAVFGMTVGAAVLHAALGLTRPPDRTYLSFACIMAMLAAWVVFEAELYTSTTSDEAVEALRHQIIAAHGLVAFILVFVPAYTRVRLPRWLLASYAVALAVLFVMNLVAPYGLWLSAQPELIATTFRGEPLTTVVAPPLGLVQYIHTVYVLSVFALTFTCALKLLRRERQRGAMLAIALVVAILQHVIDVIRDAVGGTWPYLAEFGLVTWGLIMSVQLAIDFRVNGQHLQATLTTVEQHAAELTKLVAASLSVRDKLNTPLQTLELSLATRAARKPEDDQTLAELRSAVTTLVELSRAVERTTSQERSA
jgi:hypothetical protein